MKKLAILLLVAILAVAGYIGAVKYTNYKNEIQQNDELARSERRNLRQVKLKYRIDFDVVEVRGIENLIVSDGEREISVGSDGDDYQTEEIENALFDMVKADIPTAYEFEFTGKRRYRMRYDGDNLDEMFAKQGTLYVYCVNADFEEVPVFDFLRDSINKCELYSFSSEEMLNDFIEKTNDCYGRYTYIEDYAPFIDSYCRVYYSESECEIGKYNIQEYNDMMCYQHHNIYTTKNDIEPEYIFEEIHETPFDWANDEYEFITGYALKENYDLYVWIPIPDDKKDKEFYWASEYSDYNGRKIEETQKCRIINGYAVKSFYSFYRNDDIKFALMYK